MGVSINGGTPKSSTSRWIVPYKPFWGTSTLICGTPHIFGKPFFLQHGETADSPKRPAPQHPCGRGSPTWTKMKVEQ